MVESSDDIGRAIPFISIDQKSGHFEVTSDAMEILDSLPRNMKVSVVAIAGPYRSGKSFLANRLLNQSKGFEIGSTTQACTKGIWIWNKPVQVSENHIMLLLDTEGLASTERSTNIDIKIFTLSLLLSSLFIYNQMGPITENSLEDLSLISNLTNHIHFQKTQKETGSDYRTFFPSFYWVLRDFYHDLEGQSPKKYLEDCLQPTSGLSSEKLKKNMIREAITKYFKERECFTMIRPVSDESKLAHVDSLKWEELKNDFRKEVTSFVKDVKKKLRPKVVNGKFLNASMVLSLALEYTEAINSKETPTVLTAIDRVVQAETAKITDDMYDHFCNQINESLSEENMPFTKVTFKKILRKLVRSTRYQVQKQLGQILNLEEILKETANFDERINEIVKAKLKQNYSASYHYATGLLTKLYQTVDNPFKNLPTNNNNLDSIFIHEYIRKWIALGKEYKELGKCTNQWECLVESLVKLPEGRSLFIQRELIDFDQNYVSTSTIGDEVDDLQSSSGQNSIQLHQNHHALTIFQTVIDQINDMMNDQLNKLRINQNESQANEKKLSQKKKQNDQLIDLQRVQNDDITNMKHELEMKIENLKREIQSRLQELDSLKQVKDMESKNVKRIQDRQIKEKDDEIKQLESQKIQADQTFQASLGKVQDLDSEKRKEISLVQNEIKKLEEDVEELKNKMKNKENNPFYIQVNQFFGEVKEYIEEFKKIVVSQDDSKKHKMRLFQLQKQLNDIEYQSNQNELKQKKKQDEDLRAKKDKLEQELELRIIESDQERQKIYQLQDKKQIYEQQIEIVSSNINDAQEAQKVLTNKFGQAFRSQQLKQKKLDEVQNDIQSFGEQQLRIEEQIYKISIENKQKQEDKEIILMLLPQVLKYLKGKQNNIKGFLNQMENELVKSKVQKMFLTYKIPFK